MTIRTGTSNSALGLLDLTKTHSLPAATPLGTIILGFDPETSTSAEYIFLRSPADIAVGDDLVYDDEYLGIEVPEGAGSVNATIESGDGDGAWFRLKPRSGGGAPVPPEYLDGIITEDGLFVFGTENGLSYIAQE